MLVSRRDQELALGESRVLVFVESAGILSKVLERLVYRIMVKANWLFRWVMSVIV